MSYNESVSGLIMFLTEIMKEDLLEAEKKYGELEISYSLSLEGKDKEGKIVLLCSSFLP